MSKPLRVVIVGGGIGGLSAAFRLRQLHPDARITLLEAADHLGGVIASSRRDGCLYEHGPDSLLTSKPAGLALIRELGLESGLIGVEPAARRAFVAKGGGLLPVPDGLYLLAPGKVLPFLRSKLISWPGKLRMGLDLVLPARSPGAREESLAQFVRRRLGQEALDWIAQPLAAGISTGDPEHLAIASIMPQFVEMERSHGSLIRALQARGHGTGAGGTSGPRYGLFATLRDGLGGLVDALRERLGQVELVTSAPVSSLRRSECGWMVDGLRADAVILAVPAWAASRLLEPVDAKLAALLAQVPYAGVATINLRFAAADCPVPACAGFVVPAKESRDLIACTAVTAKYAGRAPAGTTVLRAFIGGALRPQALERTDDDLIAAALRDLRSYVPSLGVPQHAQVHRWPRAMAQHTVGHRARTAEVRHRQAALPGLFLVGNGYEGVGIPDVIADAEAAARGCMAAFSQFPPGS